MTLDSIDVEFDEKAGSRKRREASTTVRVVCSFSVPETVAVSSFESLVTESAKKSVNDSNGKFIASDAGIVVSATEVFAKSEDCESNDDYCILGNKEKMSYGKARQFCQDNGYKLPLPHDFGSNLEVSKVSPEGTWINVIVNKFMVSAKSKIYLK